MTPPSSLRAEAGPGATRMRGFSFVEVILATVLLLVFLLGALHVFGGGQELVNDSRVRTRARSEHRRNLASLANAIRVADIREMSGFDADGVATEPVIRRVVGGDDAGRLHADEETIRWLPKSTPVAGVTSPGALYAVTGSGAQQLLADRVPANGFQCTMQGSAVLIELTTYYHTREGKTVLTTGPALVSLRNPE